MTDDTQTVIFKRLVTSVEEMQQDWQELKLRVERLEDHSEVPTNTFLFRRS